ncbi:MAG: hypothetical protein ACOCRO_00865 [Halanaerobiales bacterium]
MKSKYMITKFRNLDDYYVIKRISGGYTGGGATITNYDILYPENIDNETKRRIRFNIKGNGKSVKGTIFKKEKLYDNLRGVFKDLFNEK